MRGINHVFLVGHVGQDPELRTTANGRTLCRLSLATNRRVRDGEGWKELTDWHRIVFWEKNAELCQQYVRKGAAIGVEGELRMDSWTDTSGARRSRNEVFGQRLHFLGKSNRAPTASPPTAPEGGEPEAAIPF